MTKNRFNRIILIVMDSVGIGGAPDAKQYNDEEADTLGNIAKHLGGLHLPNLQSMGLGNLHEIEGVDQVNDPSAHYTKVQEASVGKDTMTGHWEIMGLRITKPFQTFPDGFPVELIHELEKRTGRKVIGNKPASGTAIIDELGEEHLNTGAIIVYTSADSVLQIAAHEDVVPLDELYTICETARELTLDEKYLVGRIIARPFIGTLGNFERTANRKDYALKPFGRTVMNELYDKNYDVIALGKIFNIYDGEGITESITTKNNDDGVSKLLQVMARNFTGLGFINLVDFDEKYGHRRNPEGYGEALETFDKRLPEILSKLNKDDLLMITADHGNDPTHHGTDHTRELVPLLVYYKDLQQGKKLDDKDTFSDIGATIAHNFNVKLPPFGQSMLDEI